MTGQNSASSQAPDWTKTGTLTELTANQTVKQWPNFITFHPNDAHQATKSQCHLPNRGLSKLRSSPTSNCAVLQMSPTTDRSSQGQTPPPPPPLNVGRHANVMICHAGDVPPSRQLPASSRGLTLQCSHQCPLQPESFQPRLRRRIPQVLQVRVASTLAARWYPMEIRWRSCHFVGV